MDIEKLATDAVSSAISRTDTMSPFISRDDKEPIWDGNIYIYKDSTKKKGGIKKVPVQVKGKMCNDLKQDSIKYSAEVSDLCSYLDDGGVMFFVVYIDNTGSNTQIYYSALLPIKLRLILTEAKGQKTKTIELKKFPDDNAEKTTVFLNFYDHMKRQTSFAHARLLSEEELVKQGLLESITFSITKYGTEPTISDIMFQDDLYMYANIKGQSIPQPLETMPLDMHLAENVAADITVNGEKYYNQYRRIRSKGKIELHVGQSLRMIFDNEAKTMQTRFEPTTMLKSAIIDLPFILDISKHHKFEIGGNSIDLSGVQQIFTEEKILALEYNRDYCLRVDELFRALRLDINYDLSKMSVADKRNTQRLFDSILDEKPVSGFKEDMPLATMIDYVGTKIALVFQPVDAPGTYRITDFFHDDSFGVFYQLDGKEHFTSKYTKLTADNFLELGNVDYEEIIGSFSQYIDEPLCADEANNLLLQMILAYDKSNDTRIDILNYAKIFSNWIVNTFNNQTCPEIAYLNALQIEKRIHPLSEVQEKELAIIAETTFLEDKPTEWMIKIGANLLLGNIRSAEYYFELMAPELQRGFLQFPIVRFWNKKVDLTTEGVDHD